MSIEAMKQALEAWQTSVYGSESHHMAMLIAMTNMAQAIEKIEKQELLEFSRGWDAGYNYAGMRFKNNFEQYLRLAITAAVEKAGAQTFKHSMNHYKNETCKEKTHD